MSVTYTQLMAMSKAQTKASDAAAQTVLAQRQRKLDAQRQEQEAREKREREQAARLRVKVLEEQAREAERLARKEQEREAREKAIAQKEAEQRDHLLHGPKRAKGENTRERDGGTRTRRSNSEDPEDSGPVLTREELRQQKRAAELKKIYSASAGGSRRSSTPASSGSRARGHLRGGAVAIVTTTPGLPSVESTSSGQSVKERIAAVPLTLTKLNIVKRDMRTIDEILVDRAKLREPKVISGEDAKEFSDWFGKPKKKDAVGTPSRVATPPNTTPASKPDDNSRSKGTPLSPSHSLSTVNSARSSPTPKHKATPKAKVVERPTASQPSSRLAPDARGSANVSTKRVESRPLKANPPSSQSMKKRPRTPSMSPEPTPKKRAVARPSSYLPDDVYSLITGGRKRESYAAYDDYSDDSDMEAGATDLEREEYYSARMAKREDEEALAEIQRHELEKKRRKQERERAREKGSKSY